MMTTVTTAVSAALDLSSRWFDPTACLPLRTYPAKTAITHFTGMIYQETFFLKRSAKKLPSIEGMCVGGWVGVCVCQPLYLSVPPHRLLLKFFQQGRQARYTYLTQRSSGVYRGMGGLIIHLYLLQLLTKL